CGAGFVTRLVTCAVGWEISAEGWLCPGCLRVYRFFGTVEGQVTAYDPPLCQAGHSPAPCIRAVWRPYGMCERCGAPGKQGDDCPQCGGAIGARTEGAPAALCPTCGAGGYPGPCRCGGTVALSLRLPWTCDKCATLQGRELVPERCNTCGHAALLLGA